LAFGRAPPRPRDAQAPAPPELIAGTLAYMAPEQTGWMNRSIDARSDLYALGVVLYELLTGSLPFTASDPMAWVHAHIAGRPVPPAERRQGIPDVVSAIVMKLLVKTAEWIGILNAILPPPRQGDAYRVFLPYPRVDRWIGILNAILPPPRVDRNFKRYFATTAARRCVSRVSSLSPS